MTNLSPHDQWNTERQFINVRQQVKLLKDQLQNSQVAEKIQEEIATLSAIEASLLEIESKFKRAYTT